MEKSHRLKNTVAWKINLSVSAIDLPQCLTIQIDMLSHLWALSTVRFFFIIKFTSSSVNVKFSNILLVLNSKNGILLL